jgi:hypothetical protein
MSIMCFVPRLFPSHIATSASAFSAIVRLRLYPAALPYLSQLAGKRRIGKFNSFAHLSPARSTPDDVPLSRSAYA